MTHFNDFMMVFRSERQRVSPAITQVFLELSTHRNLRCRPCVRNSIVDFRKTHFRPSLLGRILPQLRELRLERIVLLGFGETLSHPRISTILTVLKSLETKIVLVTNASCLSEEMS
jgi:MoaA/NifB/PqqE/SkfB family radical SAM enzyme